MTTIEVLNNGDSGLNFRTKLNDNFSDLNADKLEAADIANKQDILAEGAFVNGDKTKLNNIEAGAEANAVDSVNSQTGAVVLDKTDIGLGNADNTSDADKPVSTATQTALNGKQDVLGYNPLEDVVAGTNVTIDKTDPLNPIINSTGGGGTGDVEGPASSIDSALPLYDGVSGKLLKDSGKTITTTLGGDNTTIPTSKAVADAIGGAGGGDMLKATYDPQAIEADAFSRANHTGEQAIGTVTNLQTELDGKQRRFTSVKTSADINPAVAFTEYLVNASGGDVAISLPDVTAGNYDEFRVVLSVDSNKCLITTVGGTQIIGSGTDTVYINHTVGGSLFFRANGVDGYDVVGDSREYYRIVDVAGAGTLDLSVSGYESIAIYHCEGMVAGETRTIIIPDDPSAFEGFAFKALLDGEGTVLVKTLSGLAINGQTELAITNDGGGVELASFGDHYNIVQDSRPKAQNVALTFYSLGEDSTVVDPGTPAFYKQSCTSIDDPRFNQTTATISTTVVTASAQYGGGLISDEGIIGGVLPEGPVTSSVTATKTLGSGFATYYVEYYKYELAGGTEILLGTSTASSEINSATPTAYLVTATLPETTFGPTDRLLRKVYYNRTGGGSNPTINFYAEGTNPSFSRVSIGASSISHNILAGIQEFGVGVEKGHINFNTQVATGAANNDKLATQGYVDDNGGDPLAVISDITGVTGAGQITNTISLTQAEYDAIAVPDASTIYNITDSNPELEFVDLTTTQTVGGVKTFTDSPIVPTPTTDLQVATKKYVDDNAGGGSNTTMFNVYTSANHNLTTADTIITFNTENLDVGLNYNNATYTYTAPITGEYYFSYYLKIKAITAGDTITSAFYKNGVITYPTPNYGFNAITEGQINGDCILSLTAGDTITIRIKNNTGARGYVGAYGSALSGFKIS